MSLFREYDIRGVYGKELTEGMAEAIGKSFGTLMRRDGRKKIALGYDIRLSSPSLRSALLSGLLSTGLHVVDIGKCPTPVLYFSLFQLEVEGGVMITASHNPAEFNGFKLCRGRHSLFGDEIQEVRTLIEREDYEEGKGTLVMLEGFMSSYVHYFVAQFGASFSKKIVIDCGNAAASLVAPEIFKKLGCEVIPLYCEPDGRFPNHHPDPTVPENLADMIAEVRRVGADAGIAFDGDGDRLGVVDEKGEIIWGDRLTLLFATEILKESPGAIVISEVKASQVLYDEVTRMGGNAIMWKTGHSLIKAKMKETGALLAGEMSGHIFFSDRYFGYDDAIYAGCRLVEILCRYRRPLSSYFVDLPRTCVTPEIRIDCPDDQKFEIVERCRGFFSKKHKTIEIDGIRILFEGGWGLIRASNTQPALVLRFEANHPDLLVEIQEYVNKILAELRG
ncbi:MAG: phosphomannomutase/phosphoglucomutase [Nitrospira sp.]|nr:phosphomannomutase/phosphoglucomutase [Candidatus Manganitrophaceae bacterium]HIL35344.1 phosphomannomutase/phosphoglucomutase [Candidatus Manganitrophaceae bacterium]